MRPRRGCRITLQLRTQPAEGLSSPLFAGAEQGNGFIDAALPGVGALGCGDVVGLVPLHAVGERAEECGGLLVGGERGGEVRGAVEARPVISILSHTRGPGGCEVSVGATLHDGPVLVDDGDLQAGDAAVRAGT